MLARLRFTLVVCLAVSGCPGTDTVAYRWLAARPLVIDFRSSLDADALDWSGVPHGDAAILGMELTLPHEDAIEIWRAVAQGTTLTRVSDGASIAGHGARGLLDVEGMDWGGESPVTFVPDEPLTGGWHVLRVDFGEARALAGRAPQLYPVRAVGDVAYLRYRTDTAAVWVSTRLACDLRPPPSGELPTEGESCTFAGNFGQPLPLAAITGASVEVRYAGALVDCVPSFGARFHPRGFVVTCPFPPNDVEIEIRLVSDVVTDAAGHSPASHHVRFGELGFVDLENHQTHAVLPDFGIAEADAAAR